MTPSRIRKLSALTRGAAILSIGVVGGCAKSEPIVNAPEAQASASTTPSTEAPMALPPRVVLNAPPQMPGADDDGGAPIRRLNMTDGGRRLPPMNAPPRQPPTSGTP
ncbi:MAG: hypothetical protein ABIP39_16025 [Polyangiaceae bacterium]